MSVITKPEPQIEEIETLNEIEEVYIKAENYIREHGWTRHEYEDRVEGSVCLVGALTYAVFGKLELKPGDSSHVFAIEAEDSKYSRYIYPILRDYEVDSIADWNDSIANNVEDVYDLLHKARELAHNDKPS